MIQPDFAKNCMSKNFRVHKDEHNKLSARIKCGCCKKATAVFCHKNG